MFPTVFGKAQVNMKTHFVDIKTLKRVVKRTVW